MACRIPPDQKPTSRPRYSGRLFGLLFRKKPTNGYSLRTFSATSSGSPVVLKSRPRIATESPTLSPLTPDAFSKWVIDETSTWISVTAGVAPVNKLERLFTIKLPPLRDSTFAEKCEGRRTTRSVTMAVPEELARDRIRTPWPTIRSAELEKLAFVGTDAPSSS